MFTILKRTCLFCCLILISYHSWAQSSGPQVFVGIGGGFDYGGLGGKLEFLPDRHVGVFGGLGYNLLSLGWNAGASYKILPDKTVCPQVIAMYGYNGVFKGTDDYTSQYNMTSYGMTVGAGVDVLTGGASGNKLSVSILVPFRTQKFMDNYDTVKDDSNVDLKNKLLPIGISFGFNFNLR